MVIFYSWFLIPLSTLILASQGGWVTTNFSVFGREVPWNYILILWAFLIGSFFWRRVNQILAASSSFLIPGKERFMAGLARLLLLISVFLPYVPDSYPLASILHVALAFSATVLFYLSITILDLKLYFLFPGRFSFSTGLLALAISTTAVLLILADFIISSALELFLTVFASLWLYFFSRNVSGLTAKKSAG